MRSPMLCLCALASGAGAAAAQPVLDLPPNTVDPFSVIPAGTTVNVGEGGVIPLGVDLTNGTLNINGGEVALGASGLGTGFTNTGNTVTLTDGAVGGFFQLFASTDFAMTGGTIESFGVFNGSTARLSGGAVMRFPDTFSGGSVEIRGGSVAFVRAFTGSTVTVVGSAFTLDGEPVEDLVVDEPRVIAERGASTVLGATLADGSPFSIVLRTFDQGFSSADPSVVANGARLSVVLVSASCNPADVAEPFGVLDLRDINPFVEGFLAQDPIADQNADGVFDLSDLGLFVENFFAGCP